MHDPHSSKPLSAGGRSDHRAPAAVLTAVVAVFVATRLAILSIPSEREFDEGVYLLSARAVAHGHPLFTSVFSSQPPAFLESLAAVLRVAGDTLPNARLWMLAWATGALFAIANLAGRLSGPWSAPIAAAALAFSVTFFDLAHVVQAETPALALSLASVCMVLASRDRDWSRGLLVAAGAVFALALLFKFIVAPVALPLGFAMLLPPGAAWRPDGSAAETLRRALGRALAFSAGALVVLAIPLLVYDREAMLDQTVYFYAAKAAAYSNNPLSNLNRIGRQLIADGGVVVMAAAGAFVLRRERALLAWLLLWLAGSVAAILAQSPLFWRHFVPLSPPLALLAGAAGASLGRNWSLPARSAASLALAAALFVAASQVDTGGREPLFPWSAETQTRRRAAAAIETSARFVRDNTSDGDLVAGDDPLVVYMAGRQAPPGLCDMSQARIATKSLTLDIASRHASEARVIVMRDTGRLSRLEGFPGWLGQNYSKMRPAGGTASVLRRSFWIRANGAAPSRTH